jgi:NADH:ubiquinone oxidoreductase subunit
MTTLFLEALGAEGITMAFSEVPGALERGGTRARAAGDYEAWTPDA